MLNYFRLSIVFILAIGFLCTACQTRPYMTMKDFELVPLGESATALQSRYGKPYKAEMMPEGGLCYTYIERIPLGDGGDLYRYYILTIDEGKVIRKEYKEERSSYFQIHSP